MSSSALVRDFFRRGRAARPPVLSAAFYAAARIDGLPPGDLALDPTRLTRLLADLNRLLGADSVAVALDLPAFLAAGREPVWVADALTPTWREAGGAIADAAQAAALAAPLIDAIGRLKAGVAGAVPILVTLPGPLMIAGPDGAPDALAAAGVVGRALVDAACKAGAEIVLIREGAAGRDPRLAKALAPLVNTARYYSAATLVEAAPPPTQRMADGVLVPADALGAGEMPALPPQTRPVLALSPGLPGDAAAAETLLARLPRRIPFALALDDAAIGPAPLEAVAPLVTCFRAIAFG